MKNIILKYYLRIIVTNYIIIRSRILYNMKYLYTLKKFSFHFFTFIFSYNYVYVNIYLNFAEILNRNFNFKDIIFI